MAEVTTVVDDVAPAAAAQAPTEIAQPPATTDAPSPAPVIAVRPDTPQIATFEALQAKRKRRRPLDIELPAEDEDSEAQTLRLWLESITGPEYEELANECPASREQAARGMAVDEDKFQPLLLSKVVVEPQLTTGQWKSLRKADNWAGGEWATLVMAAQNICMQGLNVPFNAIGS